MEQSPAWDQIVEPDKSLEWMLRMLQIAEKAVPPAPVTTPILQAGRQAAWSGKFFAGEVSAEEVMTNWRAECKKRAPSLIGWGLGLCLT